MFAGTNLNFDSNFAFRVHGLLIKLCNLRCPYELMFRILNVFQHAYLSDLMWIVEACILCCSILVLKVVVLCYNMRSVGGLM